MRDCKISENTLDTSLRYLEWVMELQLRTLALNFRNKRWFLNLVLYIVMRLQPYSNHLVLRPEFSDIS